MFALSDARAADFVDVPSGSYYEDAVHWLSDEGITYGTSASTFSPDDPTDRAQVATLLWRLGGERDGFGHGFTDVPSGAFYDEAVGWMLLHKITTGATATLYAPATEATRAQIAVMLWRYAGQPEPLVTHSFDDVPAGAWYEDAVSWLVQVGITTGTGSTTFSPDSVVTRAQAAALLWRFAGEPPIGDNAWPQRSTRLYDCAIQDSIPVIECEALLEIDRVNDDKLRQTKFWIVRSDPADWLAVYVKDGAVDRLLIESVGITVLPPEIGDLTNLTQLHLLINQIDTLPPQIGNLTNLRTLNVGVNPIRSLPPEIGNLTNLTELIAGGDSSLDALPPEIGNLTNLQSLFVIRSSLADLPPELWGMDQLINLSLSNNKLSAIPSAIGNLTNLDFLQLDGNGLTNLPTEIGTLPLRQLLNVNDNQLTSLPATVWTNATLGRLYADQNQLTSVPSTVDQLASLEVLTLAQNRITTLPIELMNLANIQYVGLNNQETCITVTTPTFIDWLNINAPDWDRCP